MNSQKQILNQEVIDAVAEKQQEVFDIKFQNIIYYMENKSKIIYQEKSVPIDFLKATSEMNSLDWTDKYNHIGFDNLSKTGECVQFIRQGEDKWYAEVPILKNGRWTRYTWISYSDTKTVTNMLRLFFEEVPWFGMLSWKMRRFKH